MPDSMPDVAVLERALEQLTGELVSMLESYGVPDRTVGLVDRLVDTARNVGKVRGVEDLKARLDEHLA